MPFNTELMASAVAREIRRFAPGHQDETFFAFAVDASLMCLASVQGWEATLRRYQEEWPDLYKTAEDVEALRMNTGDWPYQGFAEFAEGDGFDRALYATHYDEAMETDDGRAPWTEYAKALDRLMGHLYQSPAFEPLRTTPDFLVTWVDHNY